MKVDRANRDRVRLEDRLDVALRLFCDSRPAMPGDTASGTLEAALFKKGDRDDARGIADRREVPDPPCPLLAPQGAPRAWFEDHPCTTLHEVSVDPG